MRQNVRAPSIHHVAPTLHRRLSQNHYLALVGALLSASIFLSMTDFFTTWIAIRIGLVEGNYTLIALSRSLGLGLLTTLGVTKGFFILGCCATSLMGVKMRGRATGFLAILVLASFVLLELAVSVNNLSLIVS